MFRFVRGFVIGLVAVFVLVNAVEVFSNVVHPFPEGTQMTHEEVCHHVEKYPAWVLAVVVALWGGTAAMGTWIAQWLGNVSATALLGLLMLWTVVANVSMLPYPLWFEVIILIAVPVCSLLGWRLAIRPAPDKMKTSQA